MLVHFIFLIQGSRSDFLTPVNSASKHSRRGWKCWFHIWITRIKDWKDLLGSRIIKAPSCNQFLLILAELHLKEVGVKEWENPNICQRPSLRLHLIRGSKFWPRFLLPSINPKQNHNEVLMLWDLFPTKFGISGVDLAGAEFAEHKITQYPFQGKTLNKWQTNQLIPLDGLMETKISTQIIPNPNGNLPRNVYGCSNC